VELRQSLMLCPMLFACVDHCHCALLQGYTPAVTTAMKSVSPVNVGSMIIAKPNPRTNRF